MATEVVLDFETASGVDLKKVGAARYAEDPTTEILCLDYQVNVNGVSSGVTNLTPEALASGMALRFWAYVCDPNVTFIAHGAGFEKAIWRALMVPYFGFPDIPNERWVCTLASAAMHAIPQELEGACHVLGLPATKDMEGSKLTRSLSKARKDGSYDRSAETLARVYEYCARDVVAEDVLHGNIGPLPPGERGVWLLDQRINERGVRLDMDFVRAAQMVVLKASVPLQAEFSKLTGTEVTKRDKFLSWLHKNGAPLPNLQKATVAATLGFDFDGEEIEEDPGALHFELSEHVRRALTIRQLIGSSSVKKLWRMEACVCSDGRARGLLQYHAAQSGRWGGRLFQPHNFPVGTVMVGNRAISPELAVSAIMTGDPEYVQVVCGAPPVEVVVGSLRHAIVAENDLELVAGDYSGIEARILLAASGQHDKAKLMADGVDIYCDMAAAIYGRPIEKERDPIERDIGKHAALGLGYGMGKDKFRKQYAKEQTLDFCGSVVNTYRTEWAPCVPSFWYGLEAAAVRCVLNGTPQEAYGIRFEMSGRWLTSRLPSGRKLWFFNPHKIQKVKPWNGETYWAWQYDVMKSGRMKRVDAFGGLLTGIHIQSMARDILVHGMTNCEREDLPTVLTVHDENIAEAKKRSDNALRLKHCMEDIPSWARELRMPIAVKSPWAGPTYRK